MFFMDDDKTYYQSDNFQHLLKAYERMVKNKKSAYFECDELMDIAEYYIRIDKLERVQDVIDYNLKLHPDEVEPLVLRTKMLINEGRYDEAKKIAYTIGDEGDVEVILLKAELHILAGEKEKAQDMLDALTQGEDNDSSFYVDILDMLLDNECLDMARPILARARALYPDDLDLWEIEGECSHQEGRLEEAVEVYNKILDEDPYSVNAWEELAKIYFEKEQFKKCIECLEFELAISDDEQYARLLMAHCYFYLEDYSHAISLYNDIHLRYPRSVVPLMFYGLCLSNTDKENEALEIFKEAIKLTDKSTPEWLQIQVNTTLSYLKLGKKRTALRHINKVLEQVSDNADLYLLQGHIFLELKEVENAGNSFSRAMDCGNRTPEEVIFMMAVSMLESGYTSVAYLTFEKLAKYEDFDMARAYPYLAFCAWALEKEELLGYVNSSLENDSAKLFDLFGLTFDPTLDGQGFIEELHKKSAKKK